MGVDARPIWSSLQVESYDTNRNTTVRCVHEKILVVGSQTRPKLGHLCDERAGTKISHAIFPQVPFRKQLRVWENFKSRDSYSSYYYYEYNINIEGHKHTIQRNIPILSEARNVVVHLVTKISRPRSKSQLCRQRNLSILPTRVAQLFGAVHTQRCQYT